MYRDNTNDAIAESVQADLEAMAAEALAQLEVTLTGHFPEGAIPEAEIAEAMARAREYAARRIHELTRAAVMLASCGPTQH
jgi:hypothetical protein